VRVCQLDKSISEAQQREIDEMHWLIQDIEERGGGDARGGASPTRPPIRGVCTPRLLAVGLTPGIAGGRGMATP
jgi:hypothetical protein